MKKILVLHGWMHSGKRYETLKEVLERTGQFEVELYEFPGFGKTEAKYKKNILWNYVNELSDYLKHHEFDCILAHSMGGNVILKTLTRLERPVSTVILLNPEYGGIPFLRPLLILFPFVFLGMYFIKVKGFLTDFIIKCISMLTINQWKYIDSTILEDARSADPWVSSVLMFEMAYDNWRCKATKLPCQNIYLLSSENDRIISAASAKKLLMDIPACHQKIISGIGHTIVLENFSGLIHEVQKICGND